MKASAKSSLRMHTKCYSSCSLFAAHLQLEWLFDRAALQQSNLSRAHKVCSHTHTDARRHTTHVLRSEPPLPPMSSLLRGIIFPPQQDLSEQHHTFLPKQRTSIGQTDQTGAGAVDYERRLFKQGLSNLSPPPKKKINLCELFD